jgi:hypothetical protein
MERVEGFDRDTCRSDGDRGCGLVSKRPYGRWRARQTSRQAVSCQAQMVRTFRDQCKLGDTQLTLVCKGLRWPMNERSLMMGERAV